MGGQRRKVVILKTVDDSSARETGLNGDYSGPTVTIDLYDNTTTGFIL